MNRRLSSIFCQSIFKQASPIYQNSIPICSRLSYAKSYSSSDIAFLTKFDSQMEENFPGLSRKKIHEMYREAYATVTNVTTVPSEKMNTLSFFRKATGITKGDPIDITDVEKIDVPEYFFKFVEIVYTTVNAVNESGCRRLIDAVMCPIMYRFGGRLVMCTENELEMFRPINGKTYHLSVKSDYTIGSGFGEDGEKGSPWETLRVENSRCFVIEAKDKLDYRKEYYQALVAAAVLYQRSNGNDPIWAIYTDASIWNFYLIKEGEFHFIKGQSHGLTISVDYDEPSSLIPLYQLLYHVCKCCDDRLHPKK